MKKVIQKRIVQVIQREITEYYCDRCGNKCGTKENRKTTWTSGASQKHYCLSTCHPSDHPVWIVKHAVTCPWCYRDAEARGDTRVAEAVFSALEGKT